MDIVYTQSFETGSTQNGATVEIDAGLTFHLARVNLPDPDPLPAVAAGIGVGVGVVWPYLQQWIQNNCPGGVCLNYG
jgi:hypothetical protein